MNEFRNWLIYCLISIFNLPGIFHYFRRFLKMIINLQAVQFASSSVGNTRFSRSWSKLKLQILFDLNIFFFCQTSIAKGAFEFLATKFLLRQHKSPAKFCKNALLTPFLNQIEYTGDTHFCSTFFRNLYFASCH